MLFNPVYIQKSNDGEAQLFGSGFPNQKPTYLFSDIIKVILSKADQAVEADGKVQGGETGIEAGISESPLMISDAEVELFDKFMKMNFTDMNVETIQGENTADAVVVLDNLKMYLKGLTNQEETTSQDVKTFEIDSSDLLVVLNIVAGNIYEKNEITAGGETDFNLELKDFIKEVENLFNQSVNKADQKIIIERSDFSVILEPLKNNKISVSLVDKKVNENVEVAGGTIQQVESLEVLNTEKENINMQSKQPVINSEKQDVPADNSDNIDASTNVIKVSSDETPLNVQVPTDKKVVVKESHVNIESTANETSETKNVKGINISTKQKNQVDRTDDKIKILEGETKVQQAEGKETTTIKDAAPQSQVKGNDKNVEASVSPGKNKVQFEVENVKMSAKNENVKEPANVSKITSTEKTIEVKEFFNGKIKIEVINVSKDSSKNSTSVKAEAVKANDFTDVQPKILHPQNSENELPQSSKVVIDSEKPENVLINSSTKIVEQKIELPAEKTIDNISKDSQPASNKQVIETKVDTNQILKSDTAENELTVKKHIPRKHEAESVKVQAADTPAETKTENVMASNHNQSAEYAAIDKKSTSEINKNNVNNDKAEVIKEKSIKTITPGKEANQQKFDSQNQSGYDKTAIAVNKINQYQKEVKETIKIVDQSRLISEIENLIKGGERKVVKFNLYPEDLGSVKISLDVSDKVVTAKIDVSNDAVRQIILTQAESLKSSLTQNGIQLASLNVSVNNSDEKTAQQGKLKRKVGTVDKKTAISDFSNRTKMKNLGYNTYDYIV